MRAQQFFRLTAVLLALLLGHCAAFATGAQDCHIGSYRLADGLDWIDSSAMNLILKVAKGSVCWPALRSFTLILKPFTRSSMATGA